jgi:hypothetical protein
VNRFVAMLEARVYTWCRGEARDAETRGTYASKRVLDLELGMTWRWPRAGPGSRPAPQSLARVQPPGRLLGLRRPSRAAASELAPVTLPHLQQRGGQAPCQLGPACGCPADRAQGPAGIRVRPARLPPNLKGPLARGDSENGSLTVSYPVTRGSCSRPLLAILCTQHSSPADTAE